MKLVRQRTRGFYFGLINFNFNFYSQCVDETLCRAVWTELGDMEEDGEGPVLYDYRFSEHRLLGLFFFPDNANHILFLL